MTYEVGMYLHSGAQELEARLHEGLEDSPDRVGHRVCHHQVRDLHYKCICCAMSGDEVTLARAADLWDSRSSGLPSQGLCTPIVSICCAMSGSSITLFSAIRNVVRTLICGLTLYLAGPYAFCTTTLLPNDHACASDTEVISIPADLPKHHRVFYIQNSTIFSMQIQ